MARIGGSGNPVSVLRNKSSSFVFSSFLMLRIDSKGVLFEVWVDLLLEHLDIWHQRRQTYSSAAKEQATLRWTIESNEAMSDPASDLPQAFHRNSMTVASFHPKVHRMLKL